MSFLSLDKTVNLLKTMTLSFPSLMKSKTNLSNFTLNHLTLNLQSTLTQPPWPAKLYLSIPKLSLTKHSESFLLLYLPVKNLPHSKKKNPTFMKYFSRYGTKFMEKRKEINSALAKSTPKTLSTNFKKIYLNSPETDSPHTHKKQHLTLSTSP